MLKCPKLQNLHKIRQVDGTVPLHQGINYVSSRGICTPLQSHGVALCQGRIIYSSGTPVTACGQGKTEPVNSTRRICTTAGLPFHLWRAAFQPFPMTPLLHNTKVNMRKSTSHLEKTSLLYRAPPIQVNNRSFNTTTTRTESKEDDVPPVPYGANLQNTISNHKWIKDDGLDKNRHILIFHSTDYRMLRYCGPVSVTTMVFLASAFTYKFSDYLVGFPHNIDALEHPAAKVIMVWAITVLYCVPIVLFSYMHPWRLYYDLITGKYTIIAPGMLLVNKTKVECSLSEMFRPKYLKNMGFKVRNRIYLWTDGAPMNEVMIQQLMMTAQENSLQKKNSPK
ncbi:uncharacterized protein LOC106155888 [Lingula anatina]|uniref:Uncharacterized protein LOC106155888 n=1 Tax=Lingula anatina TaxID=7574 RepID=A0A1S3HJS3_LINAN|nr:uncharacterized protein LOC106155888 [Lingula anatina]|eukprot:XP_013386368.1 uncharacterized protein LOC106155888 [Lingula anatina]